MPYVYRKSVYFIAVLLLLLSSVVQAQSHTLNLKDTEMEVLVSTVAQMTGKTFIIDPQVTGNVTVISSTPMDAEGIYSLFKSILQVHGYATVPAGDAVRIVPEQKAYQDNIPNASSTDSVDDLVTQVVALKHVPADEAVNVVKPLMPANSQVSSYGPGNLLILGGRAANLQRIMAIIRRIDTDSDTDIETIRLQHANAAEVVRTVKLLHEGESRVKLVADERTNSILLGGDKARRLSIRGLISHLDTPLEGDDASQVVYLNYASVESVLPVLEGVAGRGKAGEEAGGSEVAVYAHPDTNALVISAPPAVFREMEGIIRKLDIRRAQVLIEAVIAEVSLDFAKEMGVQWQLASDLATGAFGGTNFGTAGNILNAAVDPTAVNNGLNLGYIDGTVTIPGTDTEIAQLGALVSALSGDTDSNVLSTPSIVTLDNQEAQIQVGQEVPFLTGQFTNTGASDSAVNPFQTIDRKDIGLTLKVTPQVNQGDTVMLTIEQEISSLINSASAAVDLVTSKRTLSTAVMVPSNSTLVLGGLIDEDVQQIVNKVPALGDIPVLGNLFKYRSTKRTKRNLMIFIRPVIISDPAIAESVTGGKYEYIRAQQLRAREQRGYGLKASDMPVLEAYPSAEQQDQDPNDG